MKKIAICVILFLLIVPGIAWGQYSNVPRGSGGGTSLPADSDGYLKNTSGVLSWDTPAGTGDVTKVGTPTEHQQAVWTGDGTIKGVTVTGSKVMCTDANGEPVACTNLTDVAAFANPMTTAGDIIYGGADGVATRLPKGTAKQILQMNSGATAPEWTGSIQANIGFTTTGLTAGNAYYMSSGGSWTAADANGESTYPARCVAISTTFCAVQGLYTSASHGKTVGATLYITDDAGVIDTTASTTNVQSVGWVYDANTYFINVSNDYGTP